jgi:hypothetical protein
MEIKPFTISISPFIIEDLRERLGRARWPDEIPGAGWEYGTNLGYLRDLCTHWGHGFDWKEQEALLNELHHFQAEVDGLCLHFIHEKGMGGDPAAGIQRIPILLIHGWPDSFVRFLKLIPLLTAGGKGRADDGVGVWELSGPGGPGRTERVVFDVIVVLGRS